MAIEIERKFLVVDEPDPAQVLGEVRLRQGYLAVDGPVEVRLRETEGATTLTIKAGRGLERTEVEMALAVGDAEQLWPHAESRGLSKRRRRVDLGGGTIAELDVYDGGLSGLRVVEVEFADADAAERFAPPPWFGREVTSEGGWSNAELALRGRPPGDR